MSIESILRFFRVVTLFITCLLPFSAALAKSYTIGVLAYNGKQQAVKRWQPTADYLSGQIADADFEVVPLTLDDFEHAINKQSLDFILTNPGHYVRLEVEFGVSRIATFLNQYHSQTLKHFSAVIFTRKDSQIKTLEDLRGRSFAAVSEGAFGGFQLAQLAFLDHGIDPLAQLDMKWMGFPHADIVKEVMQGRVDAGIVRSGIIEKMASLNQLDMSQVKVLQPMSSEGYPFLHSTGLYPEWPFAKLPDTNTRLSKQVAVSLLNMRDDDAAALKAGGSGWTIPLSYSSVHDVLRRLQVEPYPPVPFTLHEFWAAYRPWVSVVLVLFAITLVVLARLIRTNQKFLNSQQALQQHQIQLEEVVEQRTEELLQTNQALQVEIASHIQAEKTLNEGCESLKSLYSVFARTDLDRQQKLNSIVDSVRFYLGTEFAVLSCIQGNEFEAFSFSPISSELSAPLSASLSQQSINDGQILLRENDEEWLRYICCPIHFNGELKCLFEFASSYHYQDEKHMEESRFSSELSISILSLISQWLGNEIHMLGAEKQSSDRQQDIQQRFVDLSPREKEVLNLLTQGESSKQMARSLGISTKTIEMHRANLLRKSLAKSSTELVQLAVISGIFDHT